MNISISDPLELLPYLTGAITTPSEELAAEGTQQLDVTQRAIAIGEPIPIVFCRRITTNGGVWVSPGATEGRFENNSNNDLTVNFELVLSEGDLPQIPLADLYQGACAVGEFYQTYNRRAGTWLPGSFIDDLNASIDSIQFSFDAYGTANPVWHNATKNSDNVWEFIYNGYKHYYLGSLTPGPYGPVLQSRSITADTFQIQKVPVHCGTSGTYENLTTLSFQRQFPNGDDKWNRQIHAFVREGIQVTRIIDNIYGPSNNIVDLALYLINASSRFPSGLIDTASMLTAANFTNTNSFLYNGEFKDSSNLEDWLQEIAPRFLLRLRDKEGKKGFRPLLPINNDYTIKTTAVSWVFTFTEEHLIPNGFEIEYIALSERKPICALMVWRQQPENDVGVIRTSEVRFTGEAPDGPFEQHDLSQFCTTENHAVKVGAYIVARRKYITHSLRIRVKPDTYGGTLVIGDIVRVRLLRETQPDSVSYHDYLYEVERIGKNIDGVVELDLMHFPVDSQNRSLVALAVNEAVGAGYIMPTGRADFSCNLNTSTTPVADVGGNLGGLPAESSFNSNITPNTAGVPTGSTANSSYPSSTGNISNNKTVGEDITISNVCPGFYTEWYRCPKDSGVFSPGAVPPTCELVDEGSELFTYTLTNADIDYEIVGVGRCPDPSAPTGYGSPFVIGQSNPIEPDLTQYQYARFVASTPTAFTTQWVPYGGPGQVEFLYLIGLRPISSGAFGKVRGSSYTEEPWRSTVEASSAGDSTGYGIGGVGNCPSAGLPVGTIGLGPNSAVIQTGQWEFSNDGSTVLFTWVGRDL